MLFIALGLSGGNSDASSTATVQVTLVPLPALPISKPFAQPSNFQSVQEASMSAPTRYDRLPVLIITDPKDYGDDSIAILMLLRSSRVDVRGIITTAGNVCASRGADERPVLRSRQALPPYQSSRDFRLGGTTRGGGFTRRLSGRRGSVRPMWVPLPIRVCATAKEKRHRTLKLRTS